MTAFIYFVLGLVLLIGGAELLVRGASQLAAAAKISPLTIGLTVVSLGTSAPEVAISTVAAFRGRPDLAIGNVVGSNMANVLLVLGSSALITPLVVSRKLVRLDVPILIVAGMIVYLFALDGHIGRANGALLLLAAIVYTVFLMRQGRAEGLAAAPDLAAKPVRTGFFYLLLQVGAVLVGGGLLVLGSRWLIDGAVQIAETLGISELVVGLTIVAGGTSLPELATSVVAALRKRQEIAIGNVIGSCIFNLLFVLGVVGVVSPAGLAVREAVLSFDIPVMLAVSIACLPIFFTGHFIARWEGGLFLAYYIAYTLFLILDASKHDALPLFNAIMLEFVLPLTLVTLLVLTVREWREHRSGEETLP